MVAYAKKSPLISRRREMVLKTIPKKVVEPMLVEIIEVVEVLSVVVEVGML